MKILFANDKAGFFGGVEQVIYNTAGGLRERGHTCFMAYGVAERDLDTFGERFASMHACAELGPNPPTPGGENFGAVVSRLQPDVVYFHKVTRLPPLEMVRGIRTVREVHDHDLYCPTGFKYFRRSGRVCHHKADWRCYADLAFVARDPKSPIGMRPVSVQGRIHEMRRSHVLDAILPVSSFIRDSLLQNGFPPERVHILHPILLMKESEPGPVPEAPGILFVGQLIRGKGVDLLLQALKKIRTPFTATIVGTGNSRDKLHALCAMLKLEGRVTFVDWVKHEEIGRYYAAAKVVAAPSRWPEPFTLVGQEAMRHRRPVVAFDVGGNSNWLEHERTGLLVPEQDLDAYAAALERVLRDTALARKLGDGALERVRARFSFDTYLDDLERHLRGTAAP